MFSHALLVLEAHQSSQKSPASGKPKLAVLVICKSVLLQAHDSSSNSVAVYTPCLLDPEAGLRTLNITLPEGTFCTDIGADPSKPSCPHCMCHFHSHKPCL